jgi:hypothetical protein
LLVRFSGGFPKHRNVAAGTLSVPLPKVNNEERRRSAAWP